MNTQDHDVLIEDRVEDSVRYVRFDIPKERAIALLKNNGIINSFTEYNVEENLLLSNKYNGVLYLLPATVYPVPSQTNKTDYDLEDFLSENQTENPSAVEFALTYSEETSEETNRNYAAESEACVKNLLHIFSNS